MQRLQKAYSKTKTNKKELAVPRHNRTDATVKMRQFVISVHTQSADTNLKMLTKIQKESTHLPHSTGENVPCTTSSPYIMLLCVHRLAVIAIELSWHDLRHCLHRIVMVGATGRRG